MRIDCPICKKVIALGTEICPHCGRNTMEETLDYTDRGESTKNLEDRAYIASLVLILYLELYWVFIGGFMELIGNLMKVPSHPFKMSFGWWLSIAGLVLIGIINASWRRREGKELSATLTLSSSLAIGSIFLEWLLHSLYSLLPFFFY
jgi:hypothetical protein